MNPTELQTILQAVQAGKLAIPDALQRLRSLPFEDLDFAHVDHHRHLRCGFPEVIFCPGKTAQQICGIFERLLAGGGNILATRAEPEVYKAIFARFPRALYNGLAKTITLTQEPPAEPIGRVVIVSAGTSDIPVAEEANQTARIMGSATQTIYDVGVAGLHRLLAHSQQLQQANTVVVVAGMEGALPSVVGGLVSVPVIAVPTSIGYGASFGGVAPLLTMLNSCASGVAVVNIDNGFAGGYLAALINRLAVKGPPAKKNEGTT
ncbi:MAG: nickel pincer cofactor biosynthesis protein LarB [Actinobacteria bacterium]|nr:nickel pincer cofactor biosynthesis protein LarB [Actinomycetota bacterium]